MDTEARLLAPLCCRCLHWNTVRSLLVASRRANASSDFPDRLVVTKDGIEVSYSPGQEAYVDALLVEMKQWRQTLAETEAEASADVGSGGALTYSDMKLRRDEILQTIAIAIGLNQPNNLQRKAYNAFLAQYGSTEPWTHYAPAILATQSRFAIWQKDDLISRLKDGVEIPGFSYEAETDPIP